MESDSPPVLHDEPLTTDVGEEACDDKMATSDYADEHHHEQHFDAEAAVSEVLDQSVDDQSGEHLGPSEDEVAALEAALGAGDPSNPGEVDEQHPHLMEQGEPQSEAMEEIQEEAREVEHTGEMQQAEAETEKEQSEENENKESEEAAAEGEKTEEVDGETEHKGEEKKDEEGERKENGEEIEKKEGETEGETEKKEGDVPTVEVAEPPKFMSDEEYYENLDPEELEWYKEHPADHDKSLNCTACFKQVTSDIGSSLGVCRHPSLGVGICKQCRVFYRDGNWKRDEDGYDVFCRWCAEGGELILCDKCPVAFCKRCLQRNMGRKFVSDITSSEEWKCLACDPKQIYELRALYHAVFTHQMELKAKKASKKVPGVVRSTEAGENFLEENLTEAFNIVDTCRKALDDVKEAWEKANKVIDPEIATSITRKLRKIYAINKTSMDQLDKSIVTCYVVNFPLDSTRIHMGKIEAKIDSDDEVAPPRRRTVAPKKKKPAPKKKAVKKPAPVSKKALKVPQRKKGTIVVNGRPVTGDPREYALKKKSGPAKKRYASDDEDSDIEVIGTLAPPPLKKRKTGTKSKY